VAGEMAIAGFASNGILSARQRAPKAAGLAVGALAWQFVFHTAT